MMRTFFLIISGILLTGMAQSQTPDTLLTINKKPVSKDEFLRIYTKNNQDASFDKASLDEYMDLFINFKLKVTEAESLGFDTTQSFINELSGYRAQLEKPYFSDPAADSILISEAYERMKYNVRASHILIRCDRNQLPADTLIAYNKLNNIRKRILKGEDFDKLAMELSEDPSAKTNKGDLGYFTAFSMVYEFETAAYNTPVGSISNIFRSKYGYHIVKTTDKRLDPGTLKVAHLMRAVPQGSTPEKEAVEKEKIFAIYDSIINGADYVKMVSKYSDDRGSANSGGVLRVFGVGVMIAEFEKASFELKNIGDISEPVKTAYGWHIIKLLEKYPLGTLDEMRQQIKAKVSKDIRAQRGREMVLINLKKEYKLKEYKQNIAPLTASIDSTIFKGQWDSEKLVDGTKLLFTLADTIKYFQRDFANYLNEDGLKRQKKPIEILVDEEYTRYLNHCVVELEKSQLEKKYPDFKNLMQEYHDGILLFNLTDKMVWSKAVVDTTGLEAFYEQNKMNYMWPERNEVTTYTFNNKIYEPQIIKLATKVSAKKLDYQAEGAKLIAKIHTKDTAFTLQIMRSNYSKGDNDKIDAVWSAIGVKPAIQNSDKFEIISVERLVAPEPKKLSEAKGIITADYQNYLEKEWIKQLREKYVVQINTEALNSLVK